MTPPWRRRAFAESIVDFLQSTPPGTTVMVASATDVDAKAMQQELRRVCRERRLRDMERTITVEQAQLVESYWTGGE